MKLQPDQATFCLLSFEGPDRYSRASSLGERVTNIVKTLATRGFETHLLFVGDPHLPGRETCYKGRLILHRWCQWISEFYGMGVYEGEEEKVKDIVQSMPGFIVETIIMPALAEGRLPVIMAEEWQTSEVMIRLHHYLQDLGWREKCVLLLNISNTTSLERIDLVRLDNATQLTTVSLNMMHLMQKLKPKPIIIPNGIPINSLSNSFTWEQTIEILLEKVSLVSQQKIHVYHP